MEIGNQPAPPSGVGNVTSRQLSALQLVVTVLIFLIAIMVTKGMRWREEAALGAALSNEFQKAEVALKSLLFDAYQQNQAHPNADLEQLFHRIGLNVQTQPALPPQALKTLPGTAPR